MDNFSVLNPLSWHPDHIQQHPLYAIGHSYGWLSRENTKTSADYLLSGRLYVSKSGWLLLSVPNALVRGVFDALTAPGAELPRTDVLNVPNAADNTLNAHIAVMTAAEVQKIGPDKINERGHTFHYALGSLKEIPVANIDGVSRLWALQVASPALAALRKSYGLLPLLHQRPFYIAVAVRRKNVLQDNSVSKAAEDKQPQPRVRVVMPYKNQYLMETLNNSKWPENIGKRRFIGGGIEAGETPEQAAAREMFEELGVKIKPTAFRPLGNDPREGWQHEHYLELLKHKLKPGNFNATVGSDAVVTLSHGLPEGDDYMGPDIKKLLAPVIAKAAAADKISRSGQNDLLPGGKADNLPAREFSAPALAEGAKHEHEHTDNDQIAKEIAKDHLSEDPAYYDKHKEAQQVTRPKIIDELLAAKAHSDAKRYDQKNNIIRRLMQRAPEEWYVDDTDKKHYGVTHRPTNFKLHIDPTVIPPTVLQKAASVYWNQLWRNFDWRNPITYDHTKPVFANVQDHLAKIKQRGDFIIEANRNNQLYRAALDPRYRHQLALQAFRGELPQESWADQFIYQHGNSLLGQLQGLNHGR